MAEFTIGRKQLYILPTRVGWYFTIMLFSLFAIAIKFDNQSAFMMLFLLVSVGILAMFGTHNNVIGLSINSVAPSPVFAEQRVLFPVTITNQSNKHRRSVWLKCGDFEKAFELGTGADTTILVSVLAKHRGTITCPQLVLTSQYPMGLFFCWSKRYQLPRQGIAYPLAVDLLQRSATTTGSDEPNTQHSMPLVQNDDFSGLKPYQEGDRLRDIHWASYAKTKKLVTIQREPQSGHSVLLSWNALPDSLAVEDKLRQLSHWVVTADQQGVLYSLELPENVINFDSGEEHYHTCLNALALWPNSQPNTVRH